MEKATFTQVNINDKATLQTSSRPLHLQLPVMDSTVTQIEIYELLIRKSCFDRHCFEIRDGIPIKPDGDRLLKHFDIGILPSLHLGKVIVISHWSSPVGCFLAFVCLPRRDDPDYGVALAVAVTNYYHAQLETHTKQDEPVLVLRMVWIEVYSRGVIIESGLRLLKGNTMFPLVCQILLLIPDEAKLCHMYNVPMKKMHVKTSFSWRTIGPGGAPLR